MSYISSRSEITDQISQAVLTAKIGFLSTNRSYEHQGKIVEALARSLANSVRDLVDTCAGNAEHYFSDHADAIGDEVSFCFSEAARERDEEAAARPSRGRAPYGVAYDHARGA